MHLEHEQTKLDGDFLYFIVYRKHKKTIKNTNIHQFVDLKFLCTRYTINRAHLCVHTQSVLLYQNIKHNRSVLVFKHATCICLFTIIHLLDVHVHHMCTCNIVVQYMQGRMASTKTTLLTTQTGTVGYIKHVCVCTHICTHVAHTFVGCITFQHQEHAK